MGMPRKSKLLLYQDNLTSFGCLVHSLKYYWYRLNNEKTEDFSLDYMRFKNKIDYNGLH